MSIEKRLEKLAAILRKAVTYGPDDDNTDDEVVEEELMGVCTAMTPVDKALRGFPNHTAWVSLEWEE